MSNSLINPLLPLDPSSDGPSRPAARQTYRRARVATPPEDIPSFFTVPISTTASTSIPDASPAKSLLNRFTTGNSAWRDSLASLDVQHQADEAVDEDELQLFMRKMKQEKARSQAVAQRKQSAATLPKPAVSATALPVPEPRAGISFSSSSLTDIPQTSTPPSSPPPRLAKPMTSMPIPPPRTTAGNDDDETFPVRKSGSSKSAPRRRALAFSDDEQSTPRKSPASLPSPSPRRMPAARHISPPIATASSRTASPDRNAASSRSASPDPRARSPASALDSDRGDSDHEISPPKPSRADAYLATLFADNQEETGEDMHRSTSKDSAETIKDPAGSFEEKNVNPGSGRKIKSLNQKDQEQLKRDMDRARREREIAFSRPIPKALPISAFILDATSLLSSSTIKEEVPALVRQRGSSPSTAMHITPHDEITAFTPSSHDRHKRINAYPHRQRSRSPGHQRTSSPVPQRRPRMFGTEQLSDEDEEEEMSLMDIAKQAREEATKKKEAEEKRALLAEFKRGALERYRAYAKGEFIANEDDDDELEFTISPVKPKLKLPVPDIPRKIKGPDAKAVLNRDANIVPAITKNRQAVLARAGKSIRSRPASEAVTETYAEYAAKTFKHNELRAANAGSRPAGQKVGRDKALAKDQLDKLLASSHAAQAQSIRVIKEQNFGRARVMPGKKVEDWKELVELSERRTDREEVEEDEDDEDQDFAPEDEESQVDMGSGDERDVEEDQEEVATDTDEVMVEPEVEEPLEDADKEDEENVSPIKIRRPRHTARFAITSDDEEETPKKASSSIQPHIPRAPLTEINIVQPAAPASALGDEFDLGGFGDEDAGGFSQLFEATQLNGPSAPSDGFAGLRTDAVGLLPAHAVLPQNVVSETQAQRDNALIAAEVEEAMEPVQRVQTQPKKQYLKEDGFFTQTKPATQYPTQSVTQGRRQLAGSSEISLMNGTHGLDHSSEKELEVTERSPLPATEITGSPTQGSQTLRRLRRRDSSDVITEEADTEPTQLSPELPAKNAYSLLMNRHRRSPPLQSAPIKSNLVDEQAEESDEDNGWGPTGGNGDEDDEAEEGDVFVEGLVDDQAVDGETKRLQDELAEEKRREVEKLDDAKREEQAKKITEGQYRTKRRGQDFYSDGSEDEDGKPKRWNKRQRKLRRLEGEDGLMKLDGEENVFRKAYEVDLDSDPEDVLVDEPIVMRSPERLLPYQQRRAMLLQLGQANRKRQEDEVDRLGRHGTLLLEEDEAMDEDEESQFSVTKIKRTTSLLIQDEDSLGSRTTGIRSTQAYQSFITEESQTNRRSVGITHSSVIVNKVIPSAKPTRGDLKYGNRASSGQGGGSLAGKLLASKTKSFA